MDPAALIPKSKSDVTAAYAAVAAGPAAVKEIIPELVEWLQDLNWPVAKILAPFVATIGEPAVPYLRSVLQGDDDVWKYWIVTSVISHMSDVPRGRLTADLERIAKSPTPGERTEEVDIVAREILQG
jgi:hypothetical protein